MEADWLNCHASADVIADNDVALALPMPCLRVKVLVARMGLNSYVYTYIHTYMHTYMHACMHAYTHTYIHEYIHTYDHARVQRCVQRAANECLCAGMHAWI